MAARLKVFVTSDGLTDYLVAASSRPKALAAWGLRQDVFKDGQAREVDDPALVKAALAHPGEVLRQPSGGKGKLAGFKPAKAARPPGPTKGQLKRVSDLEGQLEQLSARHEAASAKMAADQEALARRAAALSKSQAAERERLEAKLSAAKRALD